MIRRCLWLVPWLFLSGSLSAQFPPREEYVTAQEVKLVQLINDERILRGVPALHISLRLRRAAQKHAEWMAANGRLGHRGSGNSDVSTRVKWERYPEETSGEIIAEGQSTVVHVVQDWRKSEGHYAVMLSRSFAHVGVGMARRSDGRWYWCVVFAKPAPTESLPPPQAQRQRR